MDKFRLPRKTKKELEHKLWLYPADEKGNRLMANPKHSKEDYDAIKKGIVTDLFDKDNTKAKQKAYREKMNKEIFVSDEELKLYVDEIFAEKYRTAAYNTLIKAKNNPKAIVAYFNFINAYNLSVNEDSYGNVCCMSVDLAKKLLLK